MVPNKIEDWMDGIPWGFTNENFFRVAERYRDTGVKPEPFTLHNGRENRATHEIAHVIACRDEDLFDPWFGIDNFVFESGELLSTENFRKECEVTVIQEMIDVELLKDEKVREYRRKCITVYGMSFLCTDIGVIPYPATMTKKEDKKRFELQFIAQVLDKALSKWTLKKAWNELNRKRAIVASILA